MEQRVSASFNLWQLQSKEIIKYGGAEKTMKELSACVQKERKRKNLIFVEKEAHLFFGKKNPNLFVSRGHDLKREKNDHRNNYIFFSKTKWTTIKNNFFEKLPKSLQTYQSLY